MTETTALSNPNNYKILIQLKKNRPKRLKAKYLDVDYNFVEDPNKARFFCDIQSAEDMIRQLRMIDTDGRTPRVLIHYSAPTTEKEPEKEMKKNR